VVEIADSHEHFGGRTTLRVHGSGEVEVVHRESGRERRYEATLERQRIVAFGRRMADLGYTELSSGLLELEPHETQVTLALRRGAEAIHSADLPHGDREDDPRFDGVLTSYEELVGELTGSTLPYGSESDRR
jgi:hypothetical protein